MSSKTIYKLFLGLVALIIVAMGTYIFVSTTEKSPIVYTNVPFSVHDPHKIFKPGDSIQFDIERCLTEKKAFIVTSRLVNLETGQAIILPSNDVTGEEGCATTISSAIVIPEAATGTYVRKYVTIVKGKYKTFEVATETQSFEVVND